jgi:hypothetical protein
LSSQFLGTQRYFTSEQSESPQHSEQYFPFGGPPQQYLTLVKAPGRQSPGPEQGLPGGSCKLKQSGKVDDRTKKTKKEESMIVFWMDLKKIFQICISIIKGNCCVEVVDLNFFRIVSTCQR